MSKRSEIIHHLKIEISALESRLGNDNPLIATLRDQLDAHQNHTADDRRSQIYRRAAREIIGDISTEEFKEQPPVASKNLGNALVAIGDRLDHKFAEIRALNEITQFVNAGQFFDEVLNHVFEKFDTLIPYDRIGVALIDKNKSGRELVRAQWHRANYEEIHLTKGYAAVLNVSSLKTVADAGTPRILNNLEAYLNKHPGSHSTKLMLQEGIHSSLTCPLLVQGKVTGFIFFSSLKKKAYKDQHKELFLQIAGELAVTLEKTRAYEELYLRNEFIKKVFGQYVTNEVAEAALSSGGPLELGGQRRKVTILMSDLRGFTSMSEELPPEDVVDALNSHLGVMTETIMKYGGSLDNIIGDAIMAVFGVPTTKDDDAARAVACAIEMQNLMSVVNAKNAERGLPKLSMGIGINTGEVVAGNIGSDLRMKYSVIGSPVNIASRIEQLSSNGQILATKATFDEISEIVSAAGHLNVQVKGIKDPVPVYEFVGIKGPYNLKKEI